MNISCRPAVRHIPKGGSKTPTLTYGKTHTLFTFNLFTFITPLHPPPLNFAKYNQRPQSISKGKPVHFLSTLDKGSPITVQPTTKVSKTDEVEEERINSPTNHWQQGALYTPQDPFTVY